MFRSLSTNRSGYASAGFSPEAAPLGDSRHLPARQRQARVLEADGSYVQQRPEEASDGRENLGTQLRVDFFGSSDSEYLIPTRSAHLTA
jgi:hypothetical protein